MATQPTTVYSKIECLSYYRGGTGATHNATIAGDYYTSLFKFLQSITSSGLIDLVTYNTGSGGNGIGYWNEATRFGAGAFSVWRMKANGERIWDWYLYIHTNSGSTAGSFEETTAQTPTKVLGVAADSTHRAVIAQAAICVSTSLTGSVNFNPWNGTTSNGAATKGTPVWNTGSNPNNKLFVFPRQNYLSGSSATNRDNCFYLERLFNTTMPAQQRWNFFFDGHCLAMAQNYHSSTVVAQRQYKINFFGPFRLANAVTQSNPGNVLSGTGSLGFLCFSSQPAGLGVSFKSNTLPEYDTIGQLAYLNSIPEGGMLATIDKGIRTYQLASDFNAGLNFPAQPNLYMNNKITERPYSVVAVGEAGFQGFVGWLETPLIRAIGTGYLTGDTSDTGQRAVFSSDTDPTTNRSITMPWPSSAEPPGSIFISNDTAQRDGYSFTLTGYSI